MQVSLDYTEFQKYYRETADDKPELAPSDVVYFKYVLTVSADVEKSFFLYRYSYIAFAWIFTVCLTYTFHLNKWLCFMCCSTDTAIQFYYLFILSDNPNLVFYCLERLDVIYWI